MVSPERSNELEGGKMILGLESGWRVVHRGRKGIEVAVGGKRKVRLHSLLAVLGTVSSVT